MTTVALSPQIASYLKSIEGRTSDDKLLRLLETYLASQIRACEQEISKYEVKYRSTLAVFARSWEQDEVPDKHTSLRSSRPLFRRLALLEMVHLVCVARCRVAAAHELIRTHA